MSLRLRSNIVEAINSAEASALLMRAGYRVYHPVADVEGEDLVLRHPRSQKLLAVQLKSRPTIDRNRYFNKSIWMLFPDPRPKKSPHDWYLIPHDVLYALIESAHGHTRSFRAGQYSKPHMPDQMRKVLAKYRIDL